MMIRCAWLLFLVGICGLPDRVSRAQVPDKQPASQLQPEQPHDLILAVDVSLSMLMDWTSDGRTFPASDREGMRWDGLQFAVDVARSQDRVALVLYRAENVVLSKFVDESGFVSLSQKYPRFGNKTGRELLAQVLNDDHRPTAVESLPRRFLADRRPKMITQRHGNLVHRNCITTTLMRSIGAENQDHPLPGLPAPFALAASDWLRIGCASGGVLGHGMSPNVSGGVGRRGRKIEQTRRGRDLRRRLSQIVTS